MPDRRAKLLRIVCLVLGGILAIQLALFTVHATFSRGLAIPALPSLPPEMEAQSGKSTNAPAGTNAPKSVNNVSATNLAVRGSTNAVVTNSSARPAKTNIATITASQSNLAASGTNSATEVAKQGTNTVAATNANTTNASPADKTATNSPDKAAVKKGPSPGGRPGAAAKMADLPAPIKERIDRITQGEILAPVMRPLPMALLGIAGQSAFLRGADGQTGLVKEGDQLGTLKLLRIGTNRVLVEVDGEKKELMIFEGLGSESLMPKPDKTTNEPPKKAR
jgi:hypothetical protein